MVTTRRSLLALIGSSTAVLVVLVLLAPPTPAPAANGRDEAAPASLASAAEGTLPPPPTTSDTARIAPNAPESAAEWLAHPHEVGLDILVVDPLGLPIEGHRLTLAPFPCSPNESEQTTGPDGRLAMTWRTRQPRLDVQVRDARGRTQRMLLHHGRRTQLALLGQRRQRGDAFAFTRARGSEGGVRTTLSLENGNTVRLTGAPFEALLGGNASPPRLRDGLHPAACFGDALASIAPDPALPMGAPSDYAITFVEGTIAVEGMAKQAARSRTAAPQGATIDGYVFGADGKPAAKTAVVLLGTSPQPLQRAETDDQGRFQLKNVKLGDFTVRAGGDALGLATAPVAVADAATRVTLHLQRGATVQGRAVDANGSPLAQRSVEWRAIDRSWCDGATTDNDGRFVFANVPATAGDIALFLDDRRIPTAVASNVLPDSGDVVLAAPQADGSVLKCDLPPNASGQPVLVAWHVDTGIAESFRRPDQGTVWSTTKLPAGFYDVQLRVPGGGHRALGRHWLDGEHDADLGRIELPHGGAIRLQIPDQAMPADPERRTWEIYALRPDLDVRMEPGPLPRDRSLELPLGDYALAFRDHAGAVRWHRFAVKPGPETLVAPIP